MATKSIFPIANRMRETEVPSASAASLGMEYTTSADETTEYVLSPAQRSLEIGLSSFCQLLSAEVECQETLLGLCLAQGLAAQHYDGTALSMHSATLQNFLNEARALSERRECAAFALAQMLGLRCTQPKEVTLRALAEAAPEPYAGRLREYLARLQAVLKETRSVLRANRIILLRGWRTLHQAMRMLGRCEEIALTAYTKDGNEIVHHPNAAPITLNEHA